MTRRTVVCLAVAALAALALLAAALGSSRSHHAAASKRILDASSCPAGSASEREADADAKGGCLPLNKPESPIESVLAAGERTARQTMPFDTVAPGAAANALAQRNEKPKTGNAWQPVGQTPLHADSPDYAGSDPVVTAGPSMLGWKTLSGRITAFASDPANASHVFAAPATGGLWESTAGGSGWRQVGDGLPSQSMGGVAYSTANGGTIIVGTGDNAVGGVVTPSGLGVYTSRTDGRSWTKASGVPDELTTYKVAVDPTNANVSYVATSKGLFRSTDGGLSYVNVNLPTGSCAGDTTTVSCGFANHVTDVAVQQGSGAVIAAVGWAYGQRQTKAGFVMAPQNGIYTSPTGAPGSFSFQDPGASAPTKNGFAPTPVVGRTTLAIANGPNQDHNVVYALVQDATKLSNCFDAIDIPICTGTGDESLVQATYLDGAYVSRDFGKTWTKIMTPDQLRAPGTGSALEVGILGYGPGIQSWYNNWIQVDPTATDPLTHAPTRIVFGLEEIWENAAQAPVIAPTSWKVIGRYWNACLQVVAGVNCGGGNPIPGTTTHPDQHAGMFVPDATGVSLYAGNDGGAYKQHVSTGQDFSNDGWGAGINDGLNTLQPYDAEAAKDGTVVAGLQDNGEMKISPSGREDMIFGGDGFFTGIDPSNSNRIVEEYTGGVASGTTDGGKTWTSVDPQLTSALFSTPFQIDPTNADHMLTGGRDIQETPFPYEMHCYPDPTVKPCAFYDNWTAVYDLGTAAHPGDASASQTSTDRNNQTSADDLRGDYGYVGYCGPCSVFSYGTFSSGIATNVGGSASPKFLQPDGWHIAAANGLPERYITSVRIDPSDPTGKTVYVTLGGYSSHWIPPGALGEDTSKVGTGHVFVSHDAGETFTDVSGDLPDAPADWVLVHAGKLVVGTDVGVFVSTDLTGGAYSILGNLPAMPVVHLAEDPANSNRIIAATYARGVWAYTFK
jgi:hypothetical protein